MQQRLESLAMGNSDCFQLADQMIAVAAKNGTWVSLKNVHLCVQWLPELERKLFRLTPHDNMRLFLTAEKNDKIPASVIRMSRMSILSCSFDSGAR